MRSGPLPDDFAWRAEMLVGAVIAPRDALMAPTAAFAEATAAAYGLPSAAVVHNGRAPAARGRLPAAPSSSRPAGSGTRARTSPPSTGRPRASDRSRSRRRSARGAERRPKRILACGGAGRLLGATAESRLAARRPIFVSAARYEPFGLAVLEAAQAGCALVLSDIPTFRELWDGAALFFVPGDDRALAANLDALAAGPEERLRVSVMPRRRSRAYSAQAMCRDLAPSTGRSRRCARGGWS